MDVIEGTTIQELSDKIKLLDISPETFIRVIIEKENVNIDAISGQGKKTRFLFVNEDLWDGEDTPADMAENHDRYLYDEDYD